MSSNNTAFHAIVSSPCEPGLGGGERETNGDEPSKSDNDPVGHFFRHVWQKQPALYHTATVNESSPTCSMNWEAIADLLHSCREHQTSDAPSMGFFRSGQPITTPDELYASNPHAAYLDGCSIIVNHADLHHASLARYCDELQQTFPHVYCNSYLTPPNSSAVKAHADDRDVLVVQIQGRKRWKVYKTVPVPYPFDNEQVGKRGNPVPLSVLEGGLFDTTLDPGDALYLPRGYVHEAATLTEEPSFHATFAIATHDWCTSVVLSEAIKQLLQQETKHRVALPVGPCKEYESSGDSVAASLNDAMSLIQSKVTAELLEQQLRRKYQQHNQLSDKHRQRLYSNEQSRKRKAGDAQTTPVPPAVGKEAATTLTLQSKIRVSTPQERESVQMEEGRLRGLTVREETMAALMQILSKVKEGGDAEKTYVVAELRELIDKTDEGEGESQISLVCGFTLLSFAKCCVELGALAVVE